MGHIFKSLFLHDLGSIENPCVNFYPLNIEHAKLPSLEKEGWRFSAGVVRILASDFSFQSQIRNPKSQIGTAASADAGGSSFKSGSRGREFFALNIEHCHKLQTQKSEPCTQKSEPYTQKSEPCAPKLEP
jgi:hypothetical protein